MPSTVRITLDIMGEEKTPLLLQNLVATMPWLSKQNDLNLGLEL